MHAAPSWGRRSCPGGTSCPHGALWQEAGWLAPRTWGPAGICSALEGWGFHSVTLWGAQTLMTSQLCQNPAVTLCCSACPASMSSPQAPKGAQGSSHCLGVTTDGAPLSRGGMSCTLSPLLVLCLRLFPRDTRSPGPAKATAVSLPPDWGAGQVVWGVTDWGARGCTQRVGSIFGTGGVCWIWGLHLAHTWGSGFLVQTRGGVLILSQ